MSQRLSDLISCQTALETAAQVDVELIVVAHPGERGDGDRCEPPPPKKKKKKKKKKTNFGATAPNSSFIALARAASEPG